MPEMTADDLARFKAAVQLRDRCVKLAVERMIYRDQRVDEQAARTTFDAIIEVIREDERERLRAAGLLLPEGAEWQIRYGVRVGGRVSPLRCMPGERPRNSSGRDLVERDVVTTPWRSMPPAEGGT